MGGSGSAAVAYLRPALGRKGLRVETGALVSHLLIERSRVVGLVYEQGGETTRVHAEREVILCAGAINSPQIMMLSGIGDPEELAQFNIRTQVSLAGVGLNLRDHFTTAIEYRRREPGPFRHHMRLDRAALSMAQAYLFGTGYATELPKRLDRVSEKRTRAKAARPAAHYQGGPSLGGDVYLPPFKPAFADGFLTPRGPAPAGKHRQGSARFRQSSRPHPYSFQSAGRGSRLARAAAGLRLIRELGRQRALSPFVDKELAPRPDETSDDALNAHIRSSLVTAHHPCGTCRMGRDDDDLAVVDERDYACVGSTASVSLTHRYFRI